MDADTIKNIETIVLLSGKDTRFGAAGPDYVYELKSHDANVGAGETLTIQAGTLRPTETIKFDGSLETNGKFRFIGGEGNDSFKGGSGDDFIWGGTGADLLQGGSGNDSYVYRAGTDSNSAAMDLIEGFGSGDLFDLTRIDANGSAAGDAAFTFVGSAAFTGQRGELRAYQDNGLWYVEGDIDGDGSADLVISVNVSNGHLLTASDFLL
jgi:Ca2+-binding RTX toxin-like protein